MEPHHVVHGHTTSMSSIATTVLPLTFETAESEKNYSRLPFEASIPLPPSPSDPVYPTNSPSETPGAQVSLDEPDQAAAAHVPSLEQDQDRPVRPVEVPHTFLGSLDGHDLCRTAPDAGNMTVAHNEPQPTFHRAIDGDRMSLDQSEPAAHNPAVQNGAAVFGPSPVQSDADGQDTPTQGMAPAAPMDIDTLLETFRRSRDEAQRCFALKRKVQNKLRQTGNKTRTIPALRHRNRQLVECLHKDRASTFATLYSEAEERAVQVDSVSAGAKNVQDEEEPVLNNASSWTAHISQESEEALLSLLGNIRNDDSFLATRIAQLTPAQIHHLSRLHRSSAGSEPDLIHHSKGHAFVQSSRPPSRFSLKPDTYENLRDLRLDPLQLLVHGIWDCHQGPSCLDYSRRAEVWSSVCSRLISRGVTGCDNFCIAVLNEFALERPWKSQSHIEILLLEWMQTGAFILEPGSAPYHDHESADDRRTRLAAEEPRFYDRAVQQLLELLTANEAALMPESCIDLIRATLPKIADPEKRRRARGYFAMVWYCRVFLADALLSPETDGVLSKHYIASAVRQKLWRGVFGRLQTTIAFALGTSQVTSLPSRTAFLASKLVRLFDTDDSSPKPGLREPLALSHKPSFLLLRRSDILAICSSIFPFVNSSPEPPSSSLFGRAFGMTTTISAATSVGTITPMAGTASSFAPSTSSTSITSDTFFSNPMISDDGIAYTIGEAHSRPLTPGNLLRSMDDSPYVTLSRELQGIATSPQIQQIRRGPDSLGSVFYLSDGRVTLTPSQPVSAADLDRTPPSPPSPNQQGEAHESLYDMLQSCLTAISEDAYPLRWSHDLSPGATVFEPLKSLLIAKFDEAQQRLDFTTSHIWHRALVILSNSSIPQTYSALTRLASLMQSRMHAYGVLSSMYQEWLFSLSRRSQALDRTLRSLAAVRRSLRDKMWFTSDVRHSKIYDEAASVARALATMGSRESANPKEKGLWAWARKKSKVFGPERAELKALSELSAGPSRGGRAKLSDNQAEVTERWLVSGSVENFCQGEERIQRFCLEVKKAVDRLVGETAVASPSLWSSVLFTRERAEFGGLRSRNLALQPGLNPPAARGGATDSMHTSGSSRIFPFTLSPPQSRHSHGSKESSSGSAAIANPLSASSQLPPSILDSPVRLSAHPHGQPSPENSLGLYATWPLPPSPVSPQNFVPTREQLSPDQQNFLDDLRKTTTSLLLSDLGLCHWAAGSETDRWVRGEKLNCGNVEVRIADQSTPNLTTLLWPGLSNEAAASDDGSAEHHFYRERQREVSEAPSDSMPGLDSHKEEAIKAPEDGLATYPFSEACSRLLSKFRLSMDPYAKLDAVYDLVCLVALAPPLQTNNTTTPGARQMWPFTVGLPGPTVPRTRFTRLQEVTANCEERRMLSLTMSSEGEFWEDRREHPTVVHRSALAASHQWLGDPHITSMIQALLMDRRFYPDTLFRDLQFIAAFVPTDTLDATPKGTAFWTISLAAMQLKSTLTAGMVDRAGQVLAHHYERDTREPVRNESRGNSPRISGESAEEANYGIQGSRVYKGKMTSSELSITTLNDAAHLYGLAALEGDPTAARELGLFYLTKPEIVKRVTLPLSRPGDVFRSVPYPGAANNGENRSGTGNNRREDSGHAMDAGMDILGSTSTSGGGLDPAIFALALHWMEFAADAGDADARTFLRENGDLRRE